MTKKNRDKARKFVGRGISFPKKPVNVLEIAKEEAKLKGKNLSNYIVDLILKEKTKKEDIKNV